MDAAWAARKAAKENAKAAAQAVAREVAAQSRIAQNQAARKAANNASKPTSYKVPAAPSANAPKPAVPSANAPKPTPKPVANNPSSPKPVTTVPAPYVPAAAARSGVNDFAGAVAAKAAQQTAKKADDVAKYHPDNNFGKNNSRYNSDLQQKISNNNGTPTRSPEPLNNPNVQKIPTGRYPLTGQKPNVTLYHSDNGVVTNYATYDKNGMITKRVDMTGKAHGDMETPHVLDYGRNYAPNGNAYPHAPRGKNATRKPRPDELQYYKK